MNSIKIIILAMLLFSSPLFAKKCPMRVNVALQLNTASNPRTPEVSDQAQRRVCIKSGGSVVFHRTGQGANKGFSVFMKDGSWSMQGDNNSGEYTAPNVEQTQELSYGVSMPDADEDLDPVIVIVP